MQSCSPERTTLTMQFRNVRGQITRAPASERACARRLCCVSSAFTHSVKTQTSVDDLQRQTRRIWWRVTV